MREGFLLIGICLAGLAACTTRPELQSEKPEPAEPVNQAPVFLASPAPADPAPELPSAADSPPEASSFDYSLITEEIHVYTRMEIQQLIGRLDRIIESGNYQAWIGSLDQSYLEKINSRDFLAVQSQSPRLKSQTSLKNAEEYFKKVVIPSRAKAAYQIDDIDIQFMPEEEKVLAFLTTVTGQRLRLYELKNVDGIWKIAN
jgi:hypothetical protein